MRNASIVTCLIVCFMLSPVLYSQANDSDISFTQDYIAAMTKKPGAERISAFKTYVRKYPDTTKKFTRLAFYWIAMDYFRIQNYQEAVNAGKKASTLSGYDKGEQARLYLMLGNSYGIKSAPTYDKDRALSFTNKAIAVAKTDAGLKDVLATARSLKEKLTVPPPPSETPEQMIKRLVHQDEDFRGAISAYSKMSAADKNNSAIKETYGTALMKAGKYSDSANVFKALYDADQTAKFAYRLGQSYTELSRRASKYYDLSVSFLIEAGLRYGAEGSSSNKNIALKKGEHQLFSKYGYFKKLEKYNRSVKMNQASASKNEAAIRSLKKQEFLQKRHIRRNYTSIDIEAPQYELDKLTNIQKKIRMLQAGGTPDSANEMAALKKEENRIKSEFKSLISKIKKEKNL